MTLALVLLRPLALTLAIELPIAVALDVRTRRGLTAVALVNVVTNPVVNIAGIALAGVVAWSASVESALPTVLAFEVAVVLVEFLLLRSVLAISSRRAFGLSLAMNSASALAGLVFWIH